MRSHIMSLQFFIILKVFQAIMTLNVGVAVQINRFGMAQQMFYQRNVTAESFVTFWTLKINENIKKQVKMQNILLDKTNFYSK